MPETQALALQAQHLNASLDWWNTAIILALVFTALAAISVVVTTRMALKRAKQLADVQGQLIQAKDKQLSLDLKDKDLKIAEAGQKAATAESKAEGFRRDISTANQRAAEANQKAEEEHLARVRLEEKLAGWKLEAVAQGRIIKKLEKYQKAPFDLGANPAEVRFMEILDSILLSAGWARQAPKADNALASILLNGKARMNYVSGIYVEIAQSRLSDLGPAAKALVEALNAEGIPAQGQIALQEPDTTAIHIVIGNR